VLPLGVTKAGTDFTPAFSASGILVLFSPMFTTSTLFSPTKLIMSCSALTHTGHPA